MCAQKCIAYFECSDFVCQAKLFKPQTMVVTGCEWVGDGTAMVRGVVPMGAIHARYVA